MRMNLGDMVLAIISDNPGASLRTITATAASWRTVLSYLTTNPRAAWTLAKSHGDRVQSVEERAEHYVRELLHRELVAENPDKTYRLTNAGAIRLRERGL